MYIDYMFCFDNNYFLGVGYRFKVWFIGSYVCIWLLIICWFLLFFIDYNVVIIGKGIVFENFGVISFYFECVIFYRFFVCLFYLGVRNLCCSIDESLFVSYKLKFYWLIEWVVNWLRDCLIDCEWLIDRLSDWCVKCLIDWMK